MKDASGPRRQFIKELMAAGISTAFGFSGIGQSRGARESDEGVDHGKITKKPTYSGPKVIVVRFGGGVRRRETIDTRHTYSPYLAHELTKRGTLFPKMEIDALEGIETSHGQGTLYTMTGKYERYHDVGGKFLGQRFEAKVPTIFEYLRKAYDVPEHKAIIINGEDRTDEEFYSFSNHHLFGARYRSTVLSLFRFKMHLLRREIRKADLSDEARSQKRQRLEEMESLDYRTAGNHIPAPEIEEFWESWRHFYGESGLVNPRGDRLLTRLAVKTIKELRPELMMIHYNDPDYVHWGYMAHYTRGIAIIDEGLRELVRTVEADQEYRGRTIFVVVPDCGRDSNPFMAIPCQHHSNSRSAHEIFALLFGPGIPRGQIVDRRVDQTGIAATIGRLMNFATPHAEGPALEEALS